MTEYQRFSLIRRLFLCDFYKYISQREHTWEITYNHNLEYDIRNTDVLIKSLESGDENSVSDAECDFPYTLQIIPFGDIGRDRLFSFSIYLTTIRYSELHDIRDNIRSFFIIVGIDRFYNDKFAASRDYLRELLSYYTLKEKFTPDLTYNFQQSYLDECFRLLRPIFIDYLRYLIRRI
jgi:hypothetical protein